MVPNITDEIVEKQKSLQSGTCLGFGLGFKIPLIVKMEMPNPSPLSSNCDVVKIWSGSSNNLNVSSNNNQLNANTLNNNSNNLNLSNTASIPKVEKVEEQVIVQPTIIPVNSPGDGNISENNVSNGNNLFNTDNVENEKFDDSFIIDKKDSFINNDLKENGSKELHPVMEVAPSIPEIADVAINDNGMTPIISSNVAVDIPSSEPLIELIDEDDDDDSDFGPDFS